MWMFFPGLVVEFIGIVFLVAGLVTDSSFGIIAGICLLFSAIGVHIIQIMKAGRTPGQTGGTGTTRPSFLSESAGDSTVLYSDSLVTITWEAITLKNYSLLLKPRRVHFADIDHIDVLEPSLATGKYKVWGGDLFSTWFPLDSSRSSRDKIFHAYLRIPGRSVGFTVENSGVVTAILRSKGLIKTA